MQTVGLGTQADTYCSVLDHSVESCLELAHQSYLKAKIGFLSCYQM